MTEVDENIRVPFRIGSQQWGRGYRFNPNTQNYFPYRRDLARLNRDMSTVLALDFTKVQYYDHPENIMVLPKQVWQGDPADSDLYDLVPLLKDVATKVQDGKDIRDLLRNLEGTNPAAISRHLTASPKKAYQENYVY